VPMHWTQVWFDFWPGLMGVWVGITVLPCTIFLLGT
jgi:hypothetical protein